MSEPSDRKSPWGKIGALISALAGLTAIYLFLFPRQTSTPPSTAVYNNINNSGTTPTTLSIVDADLSTEVESKRILVLIPSGNYYYNIFNITVKNSDNLPHTGCSVAYQFEAARGGEGHGVLFVGNWIGWTEGKGFLFGFDLPSDPTSSHEFFTVWRENYSWPMKWARVRIACEEPKKEVSPWHDVDLTHTRWQ